MAEPTVKQVYYVRMFILETDQSRFHKLKDDLFNYYIARHDEYPKAIDMAMNMLMTYHIQPSRGGGKVAQEHQESIFFQTKNNAKIT